MSQYGFHQQNSVASLEDEMLEALRIDGHFIWPEFLDNAEVAALCEELERIEKRQISEVGLPMLEATGELDLVRSPFAYSKIFFHVLLSEKIDRIAKVILGEYYIAHLQNAIINRPTRAHHQSSWHRDLPYQNWVNSKSICFNILICLTDFTAENGATEFLPASHKIESMPSAQYIEKNKRLLIAKSGSAMIFDSMVMHRAGINRSLAPRIGLNNAYSIPLLRQQINIPALLAAEALSPYERRVLGFEVQEPLSVKDYREKRFQRRLESKK